MISFLKKYFGNLFFCITWTLIIAFLLSIPGSDLPSEEHFEVPNFDKYIHICLFGGFVILWNLYFSKRGWSSAKTLRSFFIIYVLGNSFGIGMEFLQKSVIPMRDFSTGDIIADMIGAGLAYGISNLAFL